VNTTTNTSRHVPLAFLLPPAGDWGGLLKMSITSITSGLLGPPLVVLFVVVMIEVLAEAVVDAAKLKLILVDEMGVD
jgi:hypothetical protein